MIHSENNLPDALTASFSDAIWIPGLPESVDPPSTRMPTAGFSPGDLATAVDAWPTTFEWQASIAERESEIQVSPQPISHSSLPPRGSLIESSDGGG